MVHIVRNIYNDTFAYDLLYLIRSILRFRLTTVIIAVSDIYQCRHVWVSQMLNFKTTDYTIPQLLIHGDIFFFRMHFSFDDMGQFFECNLDASEDSNSHGLF